MLSCSLKNKLGQERVLKENKRVIFFAIAHITQYTTSRQLHIGKPYISFLCINGRPQIERG